MDENYEEKALENVEELPFEVRDKPTGELTDEEFKQVFQALDLDSKIMPILDAIAEQADKSFKQLVTDIYGDSTENYCPNCGEKL